MDKTTCHCGGELLTMTNMTVGREDFGIPIRLLICSVCHDHLVELNQQDVELITKTVAALSSDGFWVMLETITECLAAIVESKETFVEGYTRTLKEVLENSKDSSKEILLSNKKSTRKETKYKPLFAIDPIWWSRN
jgi:hypothetical protein